MISTLRIIDSGYYTTIQDYPGRVGMGELGVPLSGPMDKLAFRIGNNLLGNQEGAAGLECTLKPPTIFFHDPARICLTGAYIPAYLDNELLEYWGVIRIKPNSLLRFGSRPASGLRMYILIDGGLKAPNYMGSCATFCLADLGKVRPLKNGDQIQYGGMIGNILSGKELDSDLLPKYDNDWLLHVVLGPHGNDQYFIADYINRFFESDWWVDNAYSRSGIRLRGPKPGWSRKHGGEAGLHASNVQDIPYTIGSINFSGDMPIIIGPDGPTLGGFVCLATIIDADLWKLGQMASGDRVRFEPSNCNEAEHASYKQEVVLNSIKPASSDHWITSDISYSGRNEENLNGKFYCLGGNGLLVDFERSTSDIILTRIYIHNIWLELKQILILGVIDIVPGVSSIFIRYDNKYTTFHNIRELIKEVSSNVKLDNTVIPNRTIHLPLAWDDSKTRIAIERYQYSLKHTTPWCPSNIKYLCNLNDFDEVEQLYNIVFKSAYLVMGLGDVYFGAPVATPIDPRNRLMASKYNPPRTYTPAGCVGFGGTNMCIYSTQSPGGYQLVGRTIQVWDFSINEPGIECPSLFRYFDEIHFYPVDEVVIDECRNFNFSENKFIKIENSQFSVNEHIEFLEKHKNEIEQIKQEKIKSADDKAYSM